MIYDPSSRLLWIDSVLSLFNIQFILLSMPTANHKSNLITKILYSLLIIGIMLFLFLPQNSWLFIPELLCIILLFTIPILVISGPSKSTIIYTIFLYLGIEYALSSLITWMIHLSISQTALVTYIELLLHATFSIIILFKRNSIAHTVTDLCNFLSKKIRLLILLFIWISSGLIYILSCFKANDHYIDIFIFITVSTATLLIIFIIMFPITISKELSTKHFQALLIQSEEQIKRQVEYYQLTSQKSTELRRFRHDYNNSYIGLKAYLDKSDCEGALKYLNNCDSIFEEIEHSIQFQTGNDIADALLIEKQQSAITDDTHISFSGHLPSSGIEPVDICIILGNPLDNAIEACQKLDNNVPKNITITTKLRSNMLFIDICNPVNQDIAIIDNTIKTSKEDKTLHGFGIYSLQKTLKKYNGSAQFSCTDTVFKTEISLVIP